MLKVNTSNMQYKGTDRLDITVKGNDELGRYFAPTWTMVRDLKNKKITERQYTEQYLALMRISYKTHREQWNKLLAMDSVTLVCYCEPGAFCHRVLLAYILKKLIAKCENERA